MLNAAILTIWPETFKNEETEKNTGTEHSNGTCSHCLVTLVGPNLVNRNFHDRALLGTLRLITDSGEAGAMCAGGAKAHGPGPARTDGASIHSGTGEKVFLGSVGFLVLLSSSMKLKTFFFVSFM